MSSMSELDLIIRHGQASDLDLIIGYGLTHKEVVEMKRDVLNNMQEAGFLLNRRRVTPRDAWAFFAGLMVANLIWVVVSLR